MGEHSYIISNSGMFWWEITALAEQVSLFIKLSLLSVSTLIYSDCGVWNQQSPVTCRWNFIEPTPTSLKARLSHGYGFPLQISESHNSTIYWIPLCEWNSKKFYKHFGILKKILCPELSEIAANKVKKSHIQSWTHIWHRLAAASPVGLSWQTCGEKWPYMRS